MWMCILYSGCGIERIDAATIPQTYGMFTTILLHHIRFNSCVCWQNYDGFLSLHTCVLCVIKYNIIYLNGGYS